MHDSHAVLFLVQQVYPCSSDKECSLGSYCHSPQHAPSRCLTCRKRKRRCNRDTMCCPSNRCSNCTSLPTSCLICWTSCTLELQWKKGSNNACITVSSKSNNHNEDMHVKHCIDVLAHSIPPSLRRYLHFSFRQCTFTTHPSVGGPQQVLNQGSRLEEEWQSTAQVLSYQRSVSGVRHCVALHCNITSAHLRGCCTALQNTCGWLYLLSVMISVSLVSQ